MKTKRRVLQGILVGLIGVLVALIWGPTKIWFHLYQLRSDEASARVVMHSACELGSEVRAPLIDAIYAHAAEPDVGYFRPAAFHTLACLRIADVPESHGARSLLAPDEEAITAMAHAYEHEPAVAYRQAMLADLRNVDEWTYFVLWSRIATGQHPPPTAPYVREYHPHECGILIDDRIPPEIAPLWCEHIGPVLRDQLAADSPHLREHVRVERLLDARCLGEDSAIVAGIQARAPALSGTELDEILNHAYSYPEQQRALLSTLIASSNDCKWQYALHRGLEIRRPHTEATKETLRAWTAAIDGSCLEDIFAGAPPEARRGQMSRSLGINQN